MLFMYVQMYILQLSDDDDNDSDDSIDTMTDTESQMSYNRQAGAIRKAG